MSSISSSVRDWVELQEGQESKALPALLTRPFSRVSRECVPQSRQQASTHLILWTDPVLEISGQSRLSKSDSGNAMAGTGAAWAGGKDRIGAGSVGRARQDFKRACYKGAWGAFRNAFTLTSANFPSNDGGDSHPSRVRFPWLKNPDIAGDLVGLRSISTLSGRLEYLPTWVGWRRSRS